MKKTIQKQTTSVKKHTQDTLHAMQQAFENAWENFFGTYYKVGSILPHDWENFVIKPSIDVVDEDKNIKIVAEMPGMGPDDIPVSIDGNVLNIKGEKTTSRKDKGKDYVKREISYGSYYRSIPLPETVDGEKASSNFKKGMLWVVIPKKAGSAKNTRKLKVETVKN